MKSCIRYPRGILRPTTQEPTADYFLKSTHFVARLEFYIPRQFQSFLTVGILAITCFVNLGLYHGGTLESDYLKNQPLKVARSFTDGETYQELVYLYFSRLSMVTDHEFQEEIGSWERNSRKFSQAEPLGEITSYFRSI